MEIKMGITRADVEVMVDKILEGDVEVSDFTDENLGEQIIDLVQYFGGMGRRFTAISKAEECLEKYLKKVGADFGKIFTKPEVLDKVEKAYLGNIVKPFLKKYDTIEVVKYRGFFGRVEWLEIYLDGDENGNGDVIEFPAFETGTMYKGMEEDKKYTVEELGLK